MAYQPVSSKKGKYQKKQSQHQDLLNSAQMSHKEFRVFYGLIQTYNDMASPVHMKNKKSMTQKSNSESDNCTATINSNKSD